MCPSRRGVQCIIARADATADVEAGVARPEGIPLAVVSCVRLRRRILVEVAPGTREFPRGERRSCIAVDSRSRQTGDPGDVPAAHGGADSRQADVLLRAPRRHGHGHRGRGATFPALSLVSWRARDTLPPGPRNTSPIISGACNRAACTTPPRRTPLEIERGEQDFVIHARVH